MTDMGRTRNGISVRRPRKKTEPAKRRANQSQRRAFRLGRLHTAAVSPCHVSQSRSAHGEAFQCASDTSDDDDAADSVAQPNGSASPTSATGADVAAWSSTRR